MVSCNSRNLLNTYFLNNRNIFTSFTKFNTLKKWQSYHTFEKSKMQNRSMTYKWQWGWKKAAMAFSSSPLLPFLSWKEPKRMTMPWAAPVWQFAMLIFKNCSAIKEHVSFKSHLLRRSQLHHCYQEVLFLLYIQRTGKTQFYFQL